MQHTTSFFFTKPTNNNDSNEKTSLFANSAMLTPANGLFACCAASLSASLLLLLQTMKKQKSLDERLEKLNEAEILRNQSISRITNEITRLKTENRENLERVSKLNQEIVILKQRQKLN